MNPIVDLHAQKEITKTDLDQLREIRRQVVWCGWNRC